MLTPEPLRPAAEPSTKVLVSNGCQSRHKSLRMLFWEAKKATKHGIRSWAHLFDSGIYHTPQQLIRSLVIFKHLQEVSASEIAASSGKSPRWSRLSQTGVCDGLCTREILSWPREANKICARWQEQSTSARTRAWLWCWATTTNLCFQASGERIRRTTSTFSRSCFVREARCSHRNQRLLIRPRTKSFGSRGSRAKMLSESIGGTTVPTRDLARKPLVKPI